MPYLGPLFSPLATPQAKHDGRIDQNSKYGRSANYTSKAHHSCRYGPRYTKTIVDTQGGVGEGFFVFVVDWWKR
jgi:hypothetical protein